MLRIIRQRAKLWFPPAATTTQLVGQLRGDARCDVAAECITIGLNETGNSRCRWLLTVACMLPTGRFQLGQVRPLSIADAPEIPPARIVAVACAPGAIGWMVTAYAAQPGRAQLTIAPSNFPTTPGVFAIVAGIAGGNG